MSWFQVINIILFIVLHEVHLQKVNRMSCRREATFKAKHNGFALRNGSTKLVLTSRKSNLELCARSCTNSSMCKAMIYKKTIVASKEINCQLLNTEKPEISTNDFLNGTGWTYYEPLNQVNPIKKLIFRHVKNIIH